MRRLANIVLRGMTLAGRFLLIFFLARYLEPADLGIYGLFTATIGYGLYFLGFDFYVFTVREILGRGRHEWGGLLKNQGVLSFILYVIFIPLFTLVFINKLLPWSIAGWFFTLIVLEHINQEIGRFLNAVSEPLTASLVLFLRLGVWPVAITILMYFEPVTRSLNYVFLAWAVSGSLALILGFYRITRLGISGWQKQIDWSWIGKGLNVALPLLMATLAIRGVFALDRYWFEALAGIEALATYVFFIGVSSVLVSFLDAGVFAFIYPVLIGAYNKKDSVLFRDNLRRLLMQTLILGFVVIFVSLILIDPVLRWLNRPLYIQHKDIFFWLLLANFLYALGMVPHYALYAQGFDRPIIYSHVASFIVFVGATWFISNFTLYLAVPLGLCASFFVVLLWKVVAFNLLTPSQYRFGGQSIEPTC